MKTLRIAFYFKTTFDWNGSDLEAGLGGAETALVFLAEAFVCAGHSVTVYNQTSRPGMVNGVNYRPFGEAVDGCGGAVFDIAVGVSRIPDGLGRNAKIRVHLSMEDGESWVGSYTECLARVDAIFTISPYHTRLLTERYRVPLARIYTSSLGVVARDYEQQLPKTPFKLIYCSVPQCGLAGLEPVFRFIRKELPRASIVITGDATLWGQTDKGLQAFEGFGRLPGVSLVGKVPRRELVYHQKTSVLHLYPCTCNELFCLSSMECQAAGTPTVATAAGAMGDTVVSGVTGLVLPYNPLQGYREAWRFAQAVIGLLKDPKRLARLAEAARHRALRFFTYDRLAGCWTDQFLRLLEGKPMLPDSGEWRF